MRISCVVFLAALVSIANLSTSRAGAQVFEVSGGTSTLYDAQGGSVTVRGSNYQASAGAGMVDGHYRAGAQFRKTVGDRTYIAGDDRIPFTLPTDIFDMSHFVQAEGIGFNQFTGDGDLFAFVGATAAEYSSPLFEGSRAQDAAGFLFVKEEVAPGWTASSHTIFAREITSIQSLLWEPRDKMKLAVSGGVGADHPYGAFSFDISRKRVDVQAAYIAAGSQFHRILLASQIVSEPDRENVLVTVRPRRGVSFTAGRQNFLTPLYPSNGNVQSSVDQVSGTVEAHRAVISGTVFHSGYEGTSNNAGAFSIGRDISERIHLGANYLVSRTKGERGNSSFVTNISEELTPRISINQSISVSNGQTTTSYGGSLLSNLATISADYQTYYVPARAGTPFEQALILNVAIHLFGRVTLTGASFVGPDGRLKYTTEADGVAVRGASAQIPVERSSIGKYVLRGRVTDVNGEPIAGAALVVDLMPVFTDSEGYFMFRERRRRTHHLQILTTQFLDGGNYQIVSAPISARSDTEYSAKEIVVVLQRLKNIAGGTRVTGSGESNRR